jgi:hypothetical protein
MRLFTKYMRKGQKHSKETRMKMSESAKRAGTGLWMRGRKLPREVVEKIRLANLGQVRNGNYADRERNGNWLGDQISYRGLHKFIELQLGKPTSCEMCGRVKLSRKQIHWANRSGRYLRDLNDWLRLCVPCHRQYDREHRIIEVA